jgi:hypothetical protein
LGPPDDLEPSASVTLVDGWQQLSLSVLNKAKFHEYEKGPGKAGGSAADKGADWDFYARLVSQQFNTGRTDYDKFEGSMRLLTIDAATHAAASRLGQDAANRARNAGGRLCTKKTAGTNFAEMFLFGDAITADQLKHLNMVCNTAKQDREQFKDIAPLRR